MSKIVKNIVDICRARIKIRQKVSNILFDTFRQISCSTSFPVPSGGLLIKGVWVFRVGLVVHSIAVGALRFAQRDGAAAVAFRAALAAFMGRGLPVRKKMVCLLINKDPAILRRRNCHSKFTTVAAKLRR